MTRAEMAELLSGDKQIQVDNDSVWKDISWQQVDSSRHIKSYRYKPDPKYRMFRAEEILEIIKKKIPNYGQPIILIRKSDSKEFALLGVFESGVVLAEKYSPAVSTQIIIHVWFGYLVDDYLHNGKPFGMEITE